ncbi:MaoC/PaaZ C-terminal domain-containing protein [Alkalicoccus halolimnae]|uniref:MaoC/PaaZ C-terminal domain-containing protein n=1 Tax=Alkalicoccus halolimnae TaxID=1667239 RepID=A0A5C7F6V7_9BACI|nr:MaoC/PaaZ C-terminal domain-containing protein [Alkalicoccus halolimnae]TXF85743.1 enoyl-CoA hydratase [Alkalicoccus halolimnae]
MFSKRKKIGKTMKEIKIGDEYTCEHTVNDREILLYLGFSDDANPAYIQHDYASRTPYKRPIVPQLMLTGFITSAVSMNLPGPGSVIKEQFIRFEKPMYHYSRLHLKLTVTEVDDTNEEVVIEADGIDEMNDTVLQARMVVFPPHPWKPMTEESVTFENF